MSDYFTQTFFRLNCSDQEAELLLECDRYSYETPQTVSPSNDFLENFPPSGVNPVSGYLDFLEKEEVETWGQLRSSLKKSDEGWYFASADVDVSYISVLIAKICRSAFPIRFSWATTCSVFREADFGGGITIIDENGIGGWSTTEMLEQAENGRASFLMTPV